MNFFGSGLIWRHFELEKDIKNRPNGTIAIVLILQLFKNELLIVHYDCLKLYFKSYVLARVRADKVGMKSLTPYYLNVY